MKVGIDLGTTNSALAFIDPAEDAGADFPPVHLLPIPQHVEQSLVEPRRTLPSFLFLGDDRQYIGTFAREQGAIVPTRVVHSAKSWLSNPEIDRTAKVLPWDAQEGGRILSPVEASARFLGQIREAWDAAGPEKLSEQQVVVTVPASFDEEARELTVEAAGDAGIGNLTLLEEPAAAFYAWIANHLTESRRSLFDGQLVLVCDVGGGTSDFTLIRVRRDGDQIDFTRTAVGRHLLLGGDNLDLTLAWLVESKIGASLSVRQRSALRRQCSAAKERLLSEGGPSSEEIRILGGGSSLVGGTLKAEILREEVTELALEGFLPFCELSERPQEEKQSLFHELGLPYVSDPSITRHLAAFLASAGGDAAHGPDAILFNGGFFIPDALRDRAADVVGHWYGRRPVVLENRDLDLAVAVGAAYYSYVRSSGRGLLIHGGLPRAYYIGVGDAHSDEEVSTVCLVPRGTEDGSFLELDRGDLQLVANRPVSFRLYSSLSRTGDALGDAVRFSSKQLAEEVHVHAPLNAVIRFGKRAGGELIPVKMAARLTEVGTLEIWCESKVSEHRWRLQFELRKTAAPAEKPAHAAAIVSEEAAGNAIQLIRSTFTAGNPPFPPEELPARLEQSLGLGRNSWPLGTIRRLADAFLETAEGRRYSPAWESRWLNLCGFCLRPGFGYPGDDWRVEQARSIYAGGLQFPNQIQNGIEWWIFWGRLAGGLNRSQQAEIYQRLSPTLFPRGAKHQRVNSSLLREMWRVAASLELLPRQTKTDLGEELLRRVRAGDYRESELWCLGRLGARQLFYGPINYVLPPATVTRWVEALLKFPTAHEAVISMARQTGDATRDLNTATLELVRRAIDGNRNRDRLLAVLEGEQPLGETEFSRIFGEELPSGLVFGSKDDTDERTGDH
ncbi:MAG: Hsp70 family protein [Bryobacteraceae bacterium]